MTLNPQLGGTKCGVLDHFSVPFFLTFVNVISFEKNLDVAVDEDLDVCCTSHNEDRQLRSKLNISSELLVSSQPNDDFAQCKLINIAAQLSVMR